MHSEASTPLDVSETPHPTARTSRYWPHPFYPALATASLSNITVGFLYLSSLQLTVDRLAPYCSSLYTRASLCLLHSTWQHWHFPSLRALPTSFHALGFTIPGLLALRHGPFPSSFRLQPSPASYSI